LPHHPQIQTTSKFHLPSPLQPNGTQHGGELERQIRFDSESWETMVASSPLHHETIPEVLVGTYVDDVQNYILMPQNLGSQPPTPQERACEPEASSTENLFDQYVDSVESTAPMSDDMIDDGLHENLFDQHMDSVESTAPMPDGIIDDGLHENLFDQHMDSVESTAPMSDGMIEDGLRDSNRPPEMNNTSLQNTDGISEWNWTPAKSQKIVDFLVEKPHAYEVCSRYLNEPQVTASMIEQQWRRIVTLQNAGTYLHEAVRIDWDHYNLGTDSPVWERDNNYLHNYVSQILNETVLSVSDLCSKIDFPYPAMLRFLKHFPCFLCTPHGYKFGHSSHGQPTAQPHTAESPLLVPGQSKCGACTRYAVHCFWSDNATKCDFCAKRRTKCGPPADCDRAFVVELITKRRIVERNARKAATKPRRERYRRHDSDLLHYLTNSSYNVPVGIKTFMENHTHLVNITSESLTVRWSSIVLLVSRGQERSLPHEEMQQLNDYLTKNEDVLREADEIVHDTIVGTMRSTARTRNQLLHQTLISKDRLKALLSARKWACLDAVPCAKLLHQEGKCERKRQ
jgi:hypothetical protein